jgi:zinc/manganese transport system ATP-binding protein
MMLQGSDALTVEGLSVSFPGRMVLDGVSFGLPQGNFCGLIGSNGSGKTTLLRTILGLQAPAAGRVSMVGGSRFSTGYVPQKIALDPDMPLRARDLVALGLDGHRFGLPWMSRTHHAQIDEMLEAVDARAFANQRAGELSGGQQQRILIAHALIRRPKLLLLDEPLANLDMRSAAEIVALLRRIAAEHRITVLLSAHDMNPLLSVIDRIVYLANGRAASGTTNAVVRTEVLSKLYGYHIDVIKVHGRILVVAGDMQHEHDPVHVTIVP